MLLYFITLFVLVSCSTEDENSFKQAVLNLFNETNNKITNTLNAAEELQYTTDTPNTIKPTTANCSALANADNFTQSQLFERLISQCRYDRLDSPKAVYNSSQLDAAPVKVHLRLSIHRIEVLNSIKLQFKISCLLQLRYVDARLAFGVHATKRKQPIAGGAALYEQLWNPHIIWAHEFTPIIQDTNGKNLLTLIQPDGSVLISTSVQTTLSCLSNTLSAHLNEAHCSSTITSWIYNNTELQLHWEEAQSVDVTPELNTNSTQYILRNLWRNESNVARDKAYFAGNYSSISFTIYLTKELKYSIMNYFIPCIMIVAISWVSFWLQADQTPARTTLGTSTLLSLITLSTTQQRDLTNNSYNNVYEVWFFSCTAFIICTLIEFAFVNTIWRRNHNLTLKKINCKYVFKSTLTPTTIANKNSLEFGNELYFDRNKLDLPNKGTKEQTQHKEQIKMEAANDCKNSLKTEYLKFAMTPHEVSLWIDRKARFVFPLVFILFNAIFWAYVYYI